MLKVKTSIRKSEIAGNGLFAEEDIREGTVIWTFVQGFDVVFTQDQIKALPEAAQEYLSHHVFIKDGKIIFSADNDRFTNHSNNPNTAFAPDGSFVAVRDIPNGTEITIDYKSFDDGWIEE